MAKRKNRRMFPREVRVADTAARTAAEAALTPEQRDVRTIATAIGHGVVLGLVVLAKPALGEHRSGEPDDFDRKLTAALARQYKRVVGRAITPDEAYAAIEPEWERYEELTA